MCGQLCVTTAFMRQCANSVTAGWDDETQDPPLIQTLSDIIARLAQKDPVQGDWCMDGMKSLCGLTPAPWRQVLL